MSVNKTILLGRLGKDVELKTTPSGASVANFSVATGEKYKNKQGELVETTEWHNIVVWSKLAELCQKYLSKGSQVYLEGKLQTRSWETDKGEKRYTTEVVAQTVQFVGAKGESNSTAPAQEAIVTADEIPF